MKLLLFLLLPLGLFGQVVSDATIKSNTNTLIRNANPVLRSNHSLVNDQLTDSKLSRVENYSVSGTNTYAVSIGWVNTYSQGLTLPNVFFTNGNTGASTINVNSLGAKSIQVKGAGLSGGEIIANVPYTLIYDGAYFQLGVSVGTVTNPLSIGAELIAGGATSYNGSVTKTLGIQPTSVTNSMLANSSINIAGNSTALGGSVTRDQITGIVSTGVVKQSAANTLIIATSGTDYAPPTSGAAILYGNGSGGFSNVTIGSNLTFSGGTLSASSGSLSGMTANRLQIAATSSTLQDTQYLMWKNVEDAGGTYAYSFLHAEANSSSTNITQFPLSIQSSSSGTPAIGLGSGMQFETNFNNGTHNYLITSTIESITTNVTATTEAADLVFKTMIGGVLSERLRIKGNGDIKISGTNTTGGGSAALGGNSPAVTNTAPYTWIRMVSADGSTVYIPAWK